MNAKHVLAAAVMGLSLLLIQTSFATVKEGQSKPTTSVSHTSAKHVTKKSTKAKAAEKKDKKNGKNHTGKQ